MKNKFLALALATILSIGSIGLGVTPVKAADPAIVWKMHTGTALPKTDQNYEFQLGDFNKDGVTDMYVIQQNGGSNSTEIHILNGANGFQSFLTQLPTVLQPTDDNFQFKLGDYNHDGISDMYVIKRNGSSNSTEVHVLNGADYFKSFLLHTSTILEPTDNLSEFELGDYNHDGTLDLYYIKRDGASNSTEVHVLNGADNFQSWLLHTATTVAPTDLNSEFELGDYNSDGTLDLYMINKAGNSNTTEIHVVNGADTFQSYLLQKATCLHPTDSNWSFLRAAGQLNIYCINRQGVSSTEIHVFGFEDNKLANFVSIASSQVGYVETPTNYTKYGAWYGLDGNEWCAMFVSWCANQAGILNTVVPKYALCSSGATWYSNNGCYRARSTGYVPKSGDVIFFDYGSGIHHTGIVEYYSNGYVHTIEGNSSDSVCRHSYSLSNTSIAGYGVN